MEVTKIATSDALRTISLDDYRVSEVRERERDVISRGEKGIDALITLQVTENSFPSAVIKVVTASPRGERGGGGRKGQRKVQWYRIGSNVRETCGAMAVRTSRRKRMACTCWSNEPFILHRNVEDKVTGRKREKENITSQIMLKETAKGGSVLR